MKQDEALGWMFFVLYAIATIILMWIKARAEYLFMGSLVLSLSLLLLHLRVQHNNVEAGK